MDKNKKSDFIKIAQKLGIAIPVSLLFVGNANAATSTNSLLTGNVQSFEQLVNQRKSNEVLSHITLNLRVNDDGKLLAHSDAHTNVGGNHSDRHSNYGHSDNHTNKQMCPHTDSHTNKAAQNSHTNSGNKQHTDRHTNRDTPNC